MKVLLVDDHALVRNGIASLLVANNVEVVDEASDGLEAIDKARKLKPDLILMDIQMPRCNGLEATRLIKAELPEITIVVLTVSEDDEDLFEALKSGADGYLLKNLKADEFFDLLGGLKKKEAAIAPFLTAKIIKEFARQTNRRDEGTASEGELTKREHEILRLVAVGASNKEIASALNVTENTVKYHLGNIMQKLHLRNRAQVAAYATTQGLVHNPSNR
ncbi:MAG: response regulator transcription factor [Chloroflexi bacterium]|nr:response regulator transcription factor [Chloroflexota bacterium]